MILAEKIQCLRKKYHMSQEVLAEKCGVSRQSISKWEADIALPEIEKILILSELFHVSIDFLLIDQLEWDEMKTVHSCCTKCEEKESKPKEKFEGIIIKESIKNEEIFDEVQVQKVELWRTDGRPKYWTAVFFTAEKETFPELLSASLMSDDDCGINWFTDMKKGQTKYIVFNKAILSYPIGDEEARARVCDQCRALGIPEKQMDWEE